MVHLGIGRHMQYLSRSPELLARLSQALKLMTVAEVIVICSLIFTKISICLFLLRIFGKNNKIWRRVLYFIMAFAIASNLASIAVIYPSCRPVQKVWNPFVPGICWRARVYIAIAEYNGGESPLYISREQRIKYADVSSSNFSIERLGASKLTHCLYVECSDEYQDQSGNHSLDGSGFLVRTLFSLGQLPLTAFNNYSTGVCAIIRTAWVKKQQDLQGVSPDISCKLFTFVKRPKMLEHTTNR